MYVPLMAVLAWLSMRWGGAVGRWGVGALKSWTVGAVHAVQVLCAAVPTWPCLLHVGASLG